MPKSDRVDRYIEKSEQWGDELRALREILNSTPLVEDYKWMFPCYTLDGVNVVGLAAFKNYFGLWFYQGALLKDERGVLINAQTGKTKAMRQWRFTSAKEIKPRSIKGYVNEAIQLAKDGKSVKIERSKPVAIPDELAAAFAKSKKARAAYEKLTLGRQREFASHIADAKQSTTKQRRIEKILPMIIEGVGLGDKYRR